MTRLTPVLAQLVLLGRELINTQNKTFGEVRKQHCKPDMTDSTTNVMGDIHARGIAKVGKHGACHRPLLIPARKVGFAKAE